jgi:hypothetical protein
MTFESATFDPAEDLRDRLLCAATVLVEALDIDPSQAIAWLHAYATVTGRTLSDVAADVAASTLRPHGR